MATERNPFEKIPQEAAPNVVPMTPETDIDASFEVADDGGVIVDFASEEDITMEPSEDIAEWYGDLAETLEEADLFEIATDVINDFQADKDSRGCLLYTSPSPRD